MLISRHFQSSTKLIIVAGQSSAQVGVSCEQLLSSIVYPKIEARYITGFKLALTCLASYDRFMKTTVDQFLGLSDEHIDMHSLEKPVHKDIVEPLKRLKAKAASAGFDLRIASGFRDFERQRAIWNAKAQGQRPVLAHDESELDIASLSKPELAKAILRWSALPGCSRHHWGSEIDVYDAAAIDDDYQLQLTVQEAETVFADFYVWLDGCIKAGDSEGFYQPYAVDCGGISPEPWHLSFKSISAEFEFALNEGELLDCLCSQSNGERKIELMGVVSNNWQSIYSQFIKAH
jgi:LAS superfamily LD-carboxypeptidase LdcB